MRLYYNLLWNIFPKIEQRYHLIMRLVSQNWRKASKNIIQETEIHHQNPKFITLEVKEENIYYASKFGEMFLLGVLFNQYQPKSEKDVEKNHHLDWAWNDRILWNAGLRGASYRKDLSLMQFMRQGGADDFGGVFLEACASGNVELAKKMMARGKQDWHNGFINASRSGKMEIIQLMIEPHSTLLSKEQQTFPRSVEKGVMDWDNGLKNACLGGNLEVVKLMLSKGAKLDWTLVYEACQGGNLEVVKLMIEKNASEINRINDSNAGINHGFKNCVWNSGLWKACRYGHFDIAKLMVAKGANSWNYALERACEGGHIEIVKYLIAKGANDWDKGLSATCRPLKDKSIRNKQHLEIVKLMIARGANIGEYNLPNACIQNNLELVKLLIEKGAEINEYDIKGCYSEQIKEYLWQKVKISKITPYKKIEDEDDIDYSNPFFDKENVS